MGSKDKEKQMYGVYENAMRRYLPDRIQLQLGSRNCAALLSEPFSKSAIVFQARL